MIQVADFLSDGSVTIQKTAGRDALESGTLHPDREKPGPDRGFHHVWRDFRHATMIRWQRRRKHGLQ